jgi:hypothetical protein
MPVPTAEVVTSISNFEKNVSNSQTLNIPIKTNEVNVS